MHDEYLLMISLDAFSGEDLEMLEDLPNFKALRREGTLFREVSSVFISNTYPNHTSIITGTHPFRHGITNNTYFLPERYPEKWRYDSREIQVPTLYQKAKEAGKRVCSILYPVTGKADIDYNFPEIAESMNAIRRLWTTLKNGSPGYMLSILFRLPFFLTRIKRISLDDLTTHIAADTIKRLRPNLLMLHLVETDTRKHQCGPLSDPAKKSVEEQDKRLGVLIRALKDAGIYERTGIILFGDHGCLPVHTQIEPNLFLQERGLLRRKDKRAAEYDAYFYTAGGTAFLQIFNGEKKTKIERALRELEKEPYFGRFLDSEEMRISGMDRQFQFGIEAKVGYCFGNNDHRGQHGYSLRHEGYNPFYFAKGHTVPKNQTVTGGSVVDICPLAAEILGIPSW